MSGMYFEENYKFWSFNGILNRRGFITNLLIILAVCSFLFETPIFCYYMTHFGEFVEIALNKASLPDWIKTISLCSAILEWGLLYPSIVRRMRDIIGQNNENKVYFHTFFIYAIIIICLFGRTPVLSSINFSILIIFMCLEGAISREKPKHPVIKFNWGAFIGTWIWGLLNNLPKTLWAIPFMLTPAFFYIQLIFGVKGNEWSYKNTKHENLEEFHTTQINQAMLMGTVVPVITFIVSLIIIYFVTPATKSLFLNSPEKLKQMEQTLSKIQTAQAETEFSKIETENGEYKFYIDPKIWASLSTKGKISKFYNAVSYATSQNKNDEEGYFSQISSNALSNVRIYSSYNNELLASYSLDEEDYLNLQTKISEQNIKEISKLLQAGFKFNKHPIVP